jgi:hypothetical protein
MDEYLKIGLRAYEILSKWTMDKNDLTGCSILKKRKNKTII